MEVEKSAKMFATFENFEDLVREITCTKLYWQICWNVYNTIVALILMAIK